MTGVTTDPTVLSAAAGNLSTIGDSMASGITNAAGPTIGVVSPGADPVSITTAAQFISHGQMFQAVSAQAETVYQQLVATLQSNAAAYEQAETANINISGS
ncbi:MAG TPA: PE family protein [Mycobacterium sp.]|nr:PE family protein [Mycobacterium sp.]